MKTYIRIPDKKARIIPHVVIPREHQDTPHENLRIVHLGNILPPRDATTFLKAFTEFIKTDLMQNRNSFYRTDSK